MKGYNKKLNSFIDYVFEKYKNDTIVDEFKQVYNLRQNEKQNRLPIKKEKTIRISLQTAKTCQTLIDGELVKSIYCICYSNKFIKLLEKAQLELNGDYDFQLREQISKRIKNLLNEMKGE